ncbi:hypothetical protein BKA24_001199 [Microbacterium marinum]|uniref:DUF3558 domain-containing protein n=1 Tax=Microbacterium marinum TaxID=421115 RepID=A0A7W7BPM4_9MICO|nr:hypothetical protein [Microbacterium marinum]MBB4666490.1 hypothetical protein [Microbacterium marinum]
MRLRVGILIAFVSALVLVGCAASPTLPQTVGTAAPTPEMSSSATPTPSEPPTVTVPTRFFDGDCAAVLTGAELDDLLGEGWTTFDDYLAAVDGIALPDPLPEGTLGGLTCRWVANEVSSSEVHNLSLLLLPVDQVPAEFLDTFDAKRCDPSYDTSICRLSRSVDGVWIMASPPYYGEGSMGEPSEAFLDRTIAAAAAGVASRGGAPVPATRTAQWWTLPSCEEFASHMRFDELTEGGFESGYWEGSEQAEQSLMAAADVSKDCPYYSSSDRLAPDEEHRIFSVSVYPGGHWMWDVILDGGVDVELTGARAAVAVSYDEHLVNVYATDGVNVVVAGGAEGVEFAADVAERALAALASG